MPYETEEQQQQKQQEQEFAVWDPVAQIYVGGRVPEDNPAAIKEMIANNQGFLKLFGYGSLCWNPGTGALADPSVTHRLGRARGYRRCWAQKSTDHRGNPSFPGIVCTLLKDEEFRQYRNVETDDVSMTEGLLYEVPPGLVETCLEELDFREKGGYARDVIEVIEDDSGDTVKALLYRGTPDNPAFWPRALKDLPFAAAVIAVAHGPSGENEVYLNRLDQFLGESTTLELLKKFDDTVKLAAMSRVLQGYDLHFLFGSGSNQHNQLLLTSAGGNNVAELVNNEDAHVLKEIVLCTEKNDDVDPIVNIFAGGGHSGVLTNEGRLLLFGWNNHCQLGSSNMLHKNDVPLPVIVPLDGVLVQSAALGFSHTLVIEKGSGRLLVFGDNAKGQVNGETNSSTIAVPATPAFAENEKFIGVAAGLFHSTAILESGELLLFGCNGFGQLAGHLDSKVSRFMPPDGSKVIKVACGRHHTVAVDENYRVWSFGENKYGQLGRKTSEKFTSSPELVHIPNFRGEVVDVKCGWSHTIILGNDLSTGRQVAFGFGRNDRGQLGIGATRHVFLPERIFEDHHLKMIDCGSEYTIVVTSEERVLSCGWNEHGNLSIGTEEDMLELSEVVGARITSTPGYGDDTKLMVAAGGGHMLAMRVSKSTSTGGNHLLAK